MRRTIEKLLNNAKYSTVDHLKFGWPILSLVALIGFAVFALLSDIAHKQDDTYKATTRSFVAESTANWISNNATISSEYANWNEAYQNVTLNNNINWLEGNYISSNFSSISVVRPNFGLRFTHISPSVEVEGAALTDFVRELDLSGHALYSANPANGPRKILPNGLYVIDGKLALVAAQPIHPEPSFKGPPPRIGQNVDLAVVIKLVDPAMLHALETSFSLKDVKVDLGRQPTGVSPDRIYSQLKDADGRPLGAISWLHERPGSAAFQDRITPILLGLLVIGLMTLVVSYRVSAVQLQMAEAVARSASEANKTKSNFLANVSHELRTPLNAIIGYSELIAEDCALSGAKDSEADCKKVIGSAQHLLGLINDLLDHSKIEAGKMDLCPQQTELAPLFLNVGEALQAQFDKNQSQFVLNCDPLIGEALIDGMRLKQCLLNLVSNAAKFTKDGIITLSARPLDVDGVPFIRIAVRDTGIGMNEATLAKLFSPFVQADAATAAKFGGTGLGLVITRALVEAMGGSVSVESVVGEGSIFTVLVPRGMAWNAKPQTIAPLTQAA